MKLSLLYEGFRIGSRPEDDLKRTEASMAASAINDIRSNASGSRISVIIRLLDINVRDAINQITIDSAAEGEHIKYILKSIDDVVVKLTGLPDGPPSPAILDDLAAISHSIIDFREKYVFDPRML